MKKSLTEQIIHIQNDIDVVFEKVVKLEQQLNEANDTLIKSQNMKQPDRNNFVAQYLLKWGVK